MKSRIEFSKILTSVVILVLTGIGIWSIIKYYELINIAILADSSVLPDATLPITCISTILGAVLSYCLYQLGLKASRNKYGIDSEGQPFKEKIEYTDLPDDTVDIEDNNKQVEQEETEITCGDTKNFR